MSNINELVLEVYLGKHSSFYKKYYKTGLLQRMKLQYDTEHKQKQLQTKTLQHIKK